MEKQNAKRTLALTAGLSLLLMAVVAGFAYGYIFQNIYCANSSATTLEHLNKSGFLLKIFLYCFAIVILLDVMVSYLLYVFFKRDNQLLSLISSLFRLIYSVVLGIALSKVVLVLYQLADLAGNESMIMADFQSFTNIWSLGLILFGCHLFVLGILVFRSRETPDFLGVLLLLAAICYIVTNSANQLLPWYADYKTTIDAIVSVPMALGELSLALWLVLKGGKKKN